MPDTELKMIDRKLFESIIDYENPPVIEVVCSIQFRAIEALSLPLIGRFWSTVFDEFPNSTINPPVLHIRERFGNVPSADEELTQFDGIVPPNRLMLITSDEIWLMQIQHDRFLFNWRRRDSDYVRFGSIFERFWTNWNSFKAFMAENIKEPISIDQLELTYVNHIPKGDGWNSTADIGDVFPDARWSAGKKFLGTPDTVAWRASYSLPNEQGRMHTSIQQVVRRSDTLPMILCDMTTRGMPNSDDDVSLQSWFALAREWIVRGFADLVCDRIQNDVWGRRI